MDNECVANPGLSVGIVMLPISVAIARILKSYTKNNSEASIVPKIFEYIFYVLIVTSIGLILAFGFFLIPGGDKVYYVISSVLTLINAGLLWYILKEIMKKNKQSGGGVWTKDW